MKDNTQLADVDSTSFRYCFCCHVKTGTMIYGIYVAIIHVLLLGFLVFAAIHPDVLVPQNQAHHDGIFVQTENGNFFQTIVDESAKQQFTKDNLCVMFGFTLISLLSTLALIYGVAKNVASYLMPSFCLQVFDFCLSWLTVIGCFKYTPDIKQWFHEQGLDNYPAFDYLMSLDSEYLKLLFVISLILVLIIKGYLIGMVWDCCKYIQRHAASRNVVREYSVDPNTQVLLPPRYEDAIKVPVNYPQPPAYSSE